MVSTLNSYYQELLRSTSIRSYPSIQIEHITDTADANARRKVRGAYVKWRGLTGLLGTEIKVEPGLSTIEIGFAASEALHAIERADQVLLGVNCSGPDKDKEAVGTENNHRKDFYIALLKDGDIICGSVNGYEFSYVKPNIKELYRLTTTNSRNSQFRSYEELPAGLLLFANLETREQGIKAGIFERVENVDDIVPSPLSTPHVVEIDEPFQNVKIFTTRDYLKYLDGLQGQQIEFAFGNRSLELGCDPKRDYMEASKPEGKVGLVTAALFDAPIGNNVLARRSSSRWIGGQEVPILADLRLHAALTPAKFPVPQVGAPVKIQPLPLGGL